MTTLEEGNAQFKTLSDDYLDAVAAQDNQAANEALNNLSNLQNKVLDGDFQNKVGDFLIKARAGRLQDLIIRRKKITDGLGGLAEAFTKAAKNAENAEKDLFFNKLSSVLTGVGKTINAFKDRAEAIKTQLESLDKPQDVDDVLEDVETVKGVLDGLKTDLEGIKANFGG